MTRLSPLASLALVTPGVAVAGPRLLLTDHPPVAVPIVPAGTRAA
jgi:hypothetical protein